MLNHNIQTGLFIAHHSPMKTNKITTVQDIYIFI